MNTRGAIQVGIRLDPDSWHGAGSEGIWTRLVKALADKAIVEVDNIPFFTKSLSLGDKISIAFSSGRAMLDAIVERGGIQLIGCLLRTKVLRHPRCSKR
jgi:hypothetical protein